MEEWGSIPGTDSDFSLPDIVWGPSSLLQNKYLKFFLRW
jgi:hypothetical protein